LLEGALLLNAWNAPVSCPTRDIDLLGYAENDVALMEAMFREICEVTVADDGLRFDAKTLVGRRIKEDADYQRNRYCREVRSSGDILNAMAPLKAVVRQGRLVLNAPTDLPEGSVVELAIVHDDEDPQLLAELAMSAEDEAGGNLVDFQAVIATLGARRGPRPR
jgi:hypothetical protein